MTAYCPSRKKMYAALAPPNWQAKGYHWWDFYDNSWPVTECGNPKAAVRHVCVIPDPQGNYWAWWDTKDKTIEFVFPDRVLLGMCFAYGIEAEEQENRGKAIRVRVEEIP